MEEDINKLEETIKAKVSSEVSEDQLMTISTSLKDFEQKQVEFKKKKVTRDTKGY